jgi:HlyD family secretion protein
MRVSTPLPQARERLRAPWRSLRQRRWLWVALGLALLAAAGAWWYTTRRSTASTTTSFARVTQGTMTIAVSGSGAVAAARTVELPFQQAGTITSVDVAVGQQVSAGQALATIDAGDLQLALEQAQANLKAAQAKLAQTKDGTTTPADIANAKAALASAEAQLQQTKTGSATAADISSAKAALASAQAKLDALKNPDAATLQAAQSKVDQAQTSLQSTRDSASQAKTNAQIQLQNAVNSLTQAQSKYSTALQNWQYVQSTGNDPVQPTKTNSQGKAVPNKLNDAQARQYSDTFVQAQSALDSAQNSVQQAQVAYDAARQKEVSDIAQAEAALNDAQATVAALKNPTRSDLTQAQAAVTQAQASLTKLTQGGTAADIAQSQAGVTQAQSNLDKLTAPATDADVTAAEASVLQAQVAVDTAERNLAAATLSAPFDGVVSAVAVQPGAQASTGKAAVTIVDRSKLHIDVNLSETDAAKVQVGQAVDLTFDALPDVTLKGKVATVSPAATTSQNVVTFPVQIEFDPGQTPVKVGMSATADIQLEQISNALLVPSRAIRTAGSNKTVTLLQGQGADRQTITVPVVTGQTTNGQTVITSSGGNGVPALKAGDVLEVQTAATTTTGTSNTQRRNGGFGGGFGGFGGAPPGR